MALENLTEVLVLERGCSAARDVKKEVYANGKICGIEQTAFALLHQLPDSRQLAIQSGRADHNAFSRTTACFNIQKNYGWSGEVDDPVDRSNFGCGQSGALRILGGAKHMRMVAALACNFRYQRAGLAAA